jgi:hypothetical protein
MNNRPIIEVIKDFNAGKELTAELWWDWFCTERALPAKTKKLLNCLKQIAWSPKIDLEKNYVFFKNNFPMNGSLYDDFRICNRETEDVIYTVTPRSGHKSMDGKGEVWGAENGFEEALFVGTWSQIKKWFESK